MTFNVPPPAPPPPSEWTPADDNTPVPMQGNPSGGGPSAPASVDTPSLDAFATYVGELIPSLNALIPNLNLVAVQPGAFYHADQIRNIINGLNGDSGLKSRFQQVVGDLVKGLTDIQTAVNDMSTKYKNAEDLNKMSTDDLQKEFDSVEGDFSSLMNDAASSGSKSGG